MQMTTVETHQMFSQANSAFAPLPTSKTARFSRTPGQGATEAKLLPIATLVLWLSCVTVGLIGFVLPYTHPVAPAKKNSETKAELVQVELTTEPVSSPAKATSPTRTPPTLSAVATPETTPLIAVAEPTPLIAFALPVEGPVQIVDRSEASFSRSAPVEKNAPAATAPKIQALTFGHGEGRQPAPEYPARAMRSGQEGTVVVQFTVSETGNVLSAVASKPSPWTLLNDAAIKVIREKWRFPSGQVRFYEVPIHFQL
ncbi:MAG: TonB family protein [Verrucomicrobiota bacterium]|nr:TonB family protein [Verrucomicrobiota bacterium]